MRDWHAIISGFCLGAAASILVFIWVSGAELEKWQTLMAATIALSGAILVYKSNVDSRKFQERAKRLEDRSKYFQKITVTKLASRNLYRHAHILSNRILSIEEVGNYFENIHTAVNNIDEFLDEISHLLGEQSMLSYRHIRNGAHAIVEYSNDCGGTPDSQGVRDHLAEALRLMHESAGELSFLAECALADLYERRRPRRDFYLREKSIRVPTPKETWIDRLTSFRRH